MNEARLETACMKVLDQRLAPLPVVLKHANAAASGLPDRSISWNGNTTWIEFKVLRKNETIHDVIKNARQLITCCQLERATRRCWFVVYTHDDHTLFYRPSKLTHEQLPVPELTDGTLNRDAKDRLWHRGVLRFKGHAHHEVAHLIIETHPS
jgi:hypothetical protein